MIDLTPEQRAIVIQKEIELKIQELAKLGVEHNLDISLESADGYHYTTLINRPFLIDNLNNYGWTPSSDWEESDSQSEDVSLDMLSNDVLLEAFQEQTGVERGIGDWMSSSELC